MTNETKPDAVLTASVVHVKTDYVRCPACEEANDGWHVRPHPDTVQECDHCGAKYKVAADAELKFS
jgi:NAD-dependent SIR2 family protein deacetylase